MRNEMKDDEIPTNLTPSERRYILSLPLNERRKPTRREARRFGQEASVKRYWIVEDYSGQPVGSMVYSDCFEAYLITSQSGAEEIAETETARFPDDAPHRVVPLIEHTEALETLIREAIANVDSVTSRDLREAILAVKEEVES